MPQPNMLCAMVVPITICWCYLRVVNRGGWVEMSVLFKERLLDNENDYTDNVSKTYNTVDTTKVTVDLTTRTV